MNNILVAAIKNLLYLTVQLVISILPLTYVKITSVWILLAFTN